MQTETALDTLATLARWTARATGSFMALFFLAFFVGEGIGHPSRLSLRDALIVGGFALSIAGLALAWFKPGLGGAMALTAYALHAVCEPRSAANPFLLAAAGAAALHLLAWLRLRHAAPAHALWTVPKPALYAAAAALGVFVLLAANEAFGMPPLFTSPLALTPALTGQWTSANIRLTIHPDSSVTGQIAGVPIAQARILPNRTWFGRLLNWRTDCLISGRLARPVTLAPNATSDRFTAPFTPTPTALRGSLFLNKRPTRLHLARP